MLRTLIMDIIRIGRKISVTKCPCQTARILIVQSFNDVAKLQKLYWNCRSKIKNYFASVGAAEWDGFGSVPN
jgi:hypothetical protein